MWTSKCTIVLKQIKSVVYFKYNYHFPKCFINNIPIVFLCSLILCFISASCQRYPNNASVIYHCRSGCPAEWKGHLDLSDVASGIFRLVLQHILRNKDLLIIEFKNDVQCKFWLTIAWATEMNWTAYLPQYYQSHRSHWGPPHDSERQQSGQTTGGWRPCATEIQNDI